LSFHARSCVHYTTGFGLYLPLHRRFGREERKEDCRQAGEEGAKMFK
jgi:hypothetical protein